VRNYGNVVDARSRNMRGARSLHDGGPRAPWPGRQRCSRPSGRWSGACHRRLSILDLSALGHQPMQSPCGRYWVVYNGEIYNFREIRQELEQLHHRFHSDRTPKSSSAPTRSGDLPLFRAFAACLPSRCGTELRGACIFVVTLRGEAPLLRTFAAAARVCVGTEGTALRRPHRQRGRFGGAVRIPAVRLRIRTEKPVRRAPYRSAWHGAHVCSKLRSNGKHVLVCKRTICGGGHQPDAAGLSALPRRSCSIAWSQS